MNPREYEVMFAREDAYWWYRGMRRVARSFAPALFAKGEGTRLLDAGCGTGRNLQELGAAGARPVGVDVSFRALALARERGSPGRPLLVRASVEALPFRARTFDGVLSRDVLYMVARENTAAFELARVLAPGGVIAISSPAFPALAGAHDRAVGGLRRHTAPRLAALLMDAGLRVHRTTYANFFLAAPIFFLRKVTGARARGLPREDVPSDFGLAPRPFEEILFLLLSLEARVVARARLPWGVTVFALAEKPFQGTSVAAK